MHPDHDGYPLKRSPNIFLYRGAKMGSAPLYYFCMLDSAFIDNESRQHTVQVPSAAHLSLYVYMSPSSQKEPKLFPTNTLWQQVDTVQLSPSL